MQYVNNLNTIRTSLSSYELTSHAIHDDFLYHLQRKNTLRRLWNSREYPTV